MCVIMPIPSTRHETSLYQFRLKVPASVRAKARGRLHFATPSIADAEVWVSVAHIRLLIRGLAHFSIPADS